MVLTSPPIPVPQQEGWKEAESIKCQLLMTTIHPCFKRENKTGLKLKSMSQNFSNLCKVY